MLVFDLSRKDTFKNIINWLEDLNKFGSQDMMTLLIGNKSDLKEIRQVEESEIKELISRFNLEYFEVSAKTGENIRVAFENLTKLMKIKNEELIEKNKNNKNEKSIQSIASISLDNTKDFDKKKQDKKTCCNN